MPQITGTPGNDDLTGTPGDDQINGLAGADHMAGLAGNDIYFVDDAGDVIIEANGEGTDIVYASVGYTLNAGAWIELLTTPSIASTNPVDMTGNELDNTIWGNNGANTLSGGVGGHDTLVGFLGNDIYLINNTDEVVVENAGEGTDIVYVNSSYTLSANASIELLSTYSIAGTQAYDLTGNNLDNTIWGNRGKNTLSGGFGGHDTLVGFLGNDTYQINNGDEVIVENEGEGTDIVYVNSSYTLSANASIELLSTFSIAGTEAYNMTGNNLSNTIWGNRGDNTLSGGFGGHDTLVGFLGNDTYLVNNGDEVISENVGEGTDIVYASVSYVLSAGASIELLSTNSIGETAAINLTGNELDNTIWGNAGGNILNGGNGGVDTLVGGDGDDTYIVDSNDIVIEAGGPGTGILDRVLATANYTIAAGQHVESLGVFDSATQASFTLVGNDFTQEIRGGAGGDNLIGHRGGTTFYGGFGADTLNGSGTINNFYVFDTALGAGNVDTIVQFSSGTDRIVLYARADEPFAALAAGQINSGLIRLGTAAVDADDMLIYDQTTGTLSYDADGNGAGAAVQFAKLAAGTAIGPDSFFINAEYPDHAPTIISAANVSVNENVPANTIVYQVAASDADGDRIFYSLTGVDGDRFTIDANGTVRLIASPNFEAKPSYSFTVVASDTAASTSKAVVLTIVDLPENGGTTPIINETAAPNDSLGAAQGVDRGLFEIASNPNLPDPSLPSVTIQGRIASFTDGDYYRITLNAGELLILDVDGTTEGLDSHIFLYDSLGRLLIDNDDLVTPDPGSGIQFDHNTDSFLRVRAPTTGTYYFKIESFQDQSNLSLGNYQINVSIGPVGTQAQINNENIDALISGDFWNHKNLSYGFPQLPGQYPNDAQGHAFPETLNNFGGFNANQIGATQALLQMIANVTQLTFALNSSQPGQADVRYAMSDEADVAYAYYPTNEGPGSVGGTTWFRNSPVGTEADVWRAPARGNYAWMGILHETGHALGLKHGHESPALSPDRDSVEFSIMTYRSYIGADLEGYSNEEWGYPQTLMQYDIAALQRIYGANFNTNAGDSVYTWSPSTGEMSINGVPQGAPGGNRIFMTIWDGGGIDTYDVSNYGSTGASNITVDLRPGEWSNFGQAQLAGLGSGHKARGDVANALLFENNPASLIENAIGGFEHDTFIANQAMNRFTGGIGQSDTFKWYSAADAGLGAAADGIVDWKTNSDRIDLSSIDAKSGTAGDDSFTWIGTGAFTSHEGELRYVVEGNTIRLQGDIDGNGLSDFDIILNNTTSIDPFYIML